jgi:ribose transport system substrate-binding protein
LAVTLTACGGGDGTAADSPTEETEEEPAATGGGEESPSADDGGEPPTDEASDVCDGQDGDGRTVGFANIGESVPFAVLVREGMERVAAECNVNLVNADNELDPQIALDNARNFVAQDVDGVVEFQVVADASEAICEILEGLPVIAIDIDHPECAVFMGADNRVAGEITGEGVGAVVEEMWDCEIDRIVTFEGFAAGQVNIDRLNGSIAGLQTACPDVDYGDFEEWAPTQPDDSILTRLDADRTDPAFEQGRDWLTANPGAERIVALCINEDACTGFHATVQAAGRDGQVIFGSNGADPSAHDLIRNDPYYAGAAAFFPENYAELVIPNMIRMMNGEEPTSDPLLVEHVFIDADTIDEYYPPA